MGRLISFLKPLKREYRVYYFFSFFHTGGAEKVHYQVVQATGGKDAVIFFTKKSDSHSFLKYFTGSGCTIINISKWTDNKWLYFFNLIYRGIITGYINRQKLKPVVFNGQCNFGYKISPWVDKDVQQIELIHSFNSFSYIRIPFLPFISTTVMISKKRIEDHIQFYNKTKTPLRFIEKIRYIPNAISLPENTVEKNPSIFKVIFVGRGGKEKRVHLIASIAKSTNRIDPSIQFEIIGDVSGILQKNDHPYIKFDGELEEEKQVREKYAGASALLLTSTTEGFPMVVIEAMAFGCAVLATAVGDIPYHVKDGINGFLFSDMADDEKIVEEGADRILKLKNDRQLLKTISANNTSYAKHNFGIEKFNQAYRQLFESVK